MDLVSGEIIAGQTYNLQTVVLVDGSNNYTWSEFYPNGNTDAHVDVVPSNTADLSQATITIAEDFKNLTNTPPTFSYTSGPLLAGVLAPDETISVYLHDLDDVDGITNAVFEYQWFADEVEIEGAEKSSYKITDQEIDKKSGVKITYQDDGGFTNSVYKKLDEIVVDESVSIFEVPILR